MVSFVALVVLLIVGLFAPLIAPYNPYDAATIDIMNSEIPPAWMEEGEENFLLGTDVQGRDLLSTMIYGLRLSILIGIGAVMLQAFMGILIGLIAGYIGGSSIPSSCGWPTSSFISLPDGGHFHQRHFQVAFGIGRYEELAVPLLVVIIGLAEWPVYARTVGPR